MTDDNGSTVDTVWLAALQYAGKPGALYVADEGKGATTILKNAGHYVTEEDAQAAINAFPWPRLHTPGPVLLSDVESKDHGERCKCCGKLV